MTQENTRTPEEFWCRTTEFVWTICLAIYKILIYIVMVTITTRIGGAIPRPKVCHAPWPLQLDKKGKNEVEPLRTFA
jgi:hypothetical protein